MVAQVANGAFIIQTPAAATSNYNNLYMNSAAGTNNLGYNGTSYATLAAWQAGSGKDANSTSENPLYFNPAANNYKPTQSAMDNIGTPLSVADDIIGALRSPSAPDAGAYEFSVAAKDVGVFAFLGPNPDGCYTNAETIEVQIKNYGTQVIDFSVDPVTVNCVITGPVNTTVSATLTTGTLMPTATLNVSLAPTINGTTNGTYLLNATTVMTSDGEPINDAYPEITLEVGPVAGVISSTLNSICVSDDPVLTAVGVYGGDIQWQESTVSATGPWTNVGTNSATYSPITVTQTTWYRALTVCNANDAASNVVEIIVNTPLITSTIPGTRCGIGTVGLSATGSGSTINWYNSPSSQTALSTGASFTTPVISSSTTYYVATSDGGGTANLGLPNRVGATSNSGYSDVGLMFDASVSFTLQSVAVYPIASTPSGNVTATIALKDNAGVILQSTTVSLPTSVLPGIKTLVPLNFIVPAGTQHRLVFTSATGGGITGFIRESSTGYVYPYTLPGVASITSAYTSGASSAYYYYFYDWTVVTGCESARVPVVATVTPAPTMSVTANDITLCPGGSTTVNVTSSNDPDYTYSWTSNPAGFTASGAGPHSISPTATTWYVVTATDNSAGPNTGCVAIDSVQVFTGATLASGNVSSSDVSFCASGTPTLSVAGSDGGAIQWQQSTISSGGPWTNVGTPSTVYAPGTIIQTTWYRVRVYCQSSEVFSNVVEVNVNNPQLLSSTPGSRCGAGTVNLAATADPGSTINWYANATGGAPLGTGPSFTTPVITTTTDFYAAASVGGSGNQNVGKTSITTSASVVGTYYLNFTVYVPTTIASVKCYFNAIGTPFILNIRDAGTLASVFTASGTTTVNGTVTPQTITLNATLAPGNYQMGWSTDPGTYRESTGATYPYAIPGIISITGNTFNDLNYYYYFYDWSVVTGCEGLRTAVTATVNPSPAITAVSGASTVCSGNPTTVSVSSSNDPNYTYSWTSTPAGFTATGAGPHTVNPTAASTTYTVSAVDNTAGPFSGCGALNTVVISTTPNSLSATATATPSSVCLGSDVQLQVTASSSGYSMNTSCATSFIDISVSGTSIGTVADDSEHNIPVPSFTFNGVTYTQAVVGMNGVIVLGATSGDITLTNAALPTTSVAAGNVFLAPYWDDLDINLGATVKYQTVGNIFIIQWTNTDHNLFTTGGITFQVQMNLVTGVVTYIYPDAVFGSATYDLGLTATIGIQMSTTSAVQYSFNTASLTNGQCINFTPVSPAVTYDWSANSTFLTSTSIANPIAEAVTSDQTYSVTVTQTSTGCIKVATVPVITLALPDPLIGSNAPVCQGQDIALFGSNEALGQTTGNSFSWTGPNGFLSGSQNPTVTGVTTASVGYYVLTVQNSFGCTEVDSINVQLFDSPALNILSQTNVACNGALTGAYTVEVTNPIPFGNYLYNDGTNTQFNDGTFTGVGAGTYNVEVTDDNSCSTTIPVTITEPDPTTTANAGTDQSSCLGNTATLAGNAALVGTGSWTVTAGGATVTDPSDPNSTVTGLTAGLNTFRWTIDNAFCANSNFDEVDITTNVLPTASISGTTEICNGNSTTLTVVFTGTAPYTYSYSNGLTTFGPFTTSNTTENITVAPTATRTYTITAVDDSNCPGTPSGSAVVTVTQAPPANSVFIVSSPATGCVGHAAVANVNPVIGATLYTWTVFPNTLINGQSGGVATTTVPTATFTLGSLPANESGWDICVTASNACGQTNTKCLTIRGALSTPAVISGTTVACASSSGTYSTGTVAGASGYSWTGTNGITFSGSGTSITANFPSGFTSGQICVAATLSCGYTGPQRCITVTSSVSQLGLMSGPFAVCPGQSGLVFSVPANSGLSSYTWTAPSGVTITSGQGTNSVTVSVAPGFNLGSMCVTGTSNCGIVSAARCKTVSSTLPLTPGNISGASTGVCNQTITYSVPALSGVTSYNWTAPIGATVVSGQGTNTVDISYPNGFSNGQLCVTAQNGCGISAARCINIKGVPASPGVISGPVTVCTGEQGLTYSIAAMFGASSYTWVVPAGSSIIAGQGTSSIIVDWGTTSGLVTVTATNSCGVSGTRTLNVIVNCKLSGNEIPGVLVNAYPNPVASELTVEVSSEKANDYALELTDVSGRVVYSGQMNTTGGMKTTTVDVSTLSKGMYMLTVRSNDGFTNQIRIAVQ
ncbi:MAG: T9SS type A sorting domain-containing protein [Bacteroidetes bacterium]|nr:T9SS type A sorting domain-containing protein [Bacteroidota bacterium]